MTDIARIRAAAQRMAGKVRETPLLSAPLLDRIAGRRVLVKAECLQITGSFKARGAWAALSALPDTVRARGVIAYSSGNHAQGVAFAAARHAVPAVIVMPSDAPAVKISNTRAYGAEVIVYDRATGDRDAIGAALVAERGLTLIKPYDNAEVIAGQGTVGLEIARQARDAGAGDAPVITCCGGGGLAAGIALALEADAPEMVLHTAEPAGFEDMARSLALGQIVRNDRLTGSICDAILTPQPGAVTFPVLQRRFAQGHVGRGCVVTDDQALQAVALAFQYLRIVLEPGGAVALAAALWSNDLPDTVIAVATGGNVDPATFCTALDRHGT